VNHRKIVSFRTLLLLVGVLFWQNSLHAQKPLTAPDDLLLAAMEKELHRGQAELAKDGRE
jgi:hypothetical protein